jgi:gluconate kinase
MLHDSMLAALERPAADETPIMVDVSSGPETMVWRITAALGLP